MKDFETWWNNEAIRIAHCSDKNKAKAAWIAGIKANDTTKKWAITLQHFGTKKTKVIMKPGGLSEAEARRNACIKAGNYWRIIKVDYIVGADATAV